MDDTARLDVVAKAICAAHTGDIDAWDITYAAGRDSYRRMAQAAIDALQLTPEKERHKRCVCRHGKIDHDSYGNGHCGANMVTRYTPCPCTGFVAQNRHRLVSPWERVE